MPSLPPLDHHPSLDALGAHLRLFREALAHGHAHQIAARKAGDITAHAYLAHHGAYQDAHAIAMGYWGGRGLLTAYARMHALTPAMDAGLRGPGVAARLRDRGVIDPHAVWRHPFACLPSPLP